MPLGGGGGDEGGHGGGLPPPSPTIRVSVVFRDTGETEGSADLYCSVASFNGSVLSALLAASRALSFSKIVEVTGFFPTDYTSTPASVGPFDSWDKLSLRYSMADGSHLNVAIPGPVESLFGSRRKLDTSSGLWTLAAADLSPALRSLSGASVATLLDGYRSRRTPGGNG